ncbi:MAG: AraC family transcriptional regulator [Defluviitaleaceae bacterium]|nr:AraC family transcriptional regulator [Defluviitaleaceae bacterium]
MDWLQGMNEALEYIEANITGELRVEALARIVCCSASEFSRVFSFAAGMSVSEYIRRRRLSQAVFDIQNGRESIVDIALKYRYESQSAFTRAFKELHGRTPAEARKRGVFMKTYPKITFKLIIKGVSEMDFRIENRDGFRILGQKSRGGWDDWMDFMKVYNDKMLAGGYYKAPFWQVGAYNFIPPGGTSFCDNCQCIIGCEYAGEPLVEGLEIETFPAGTWAVFACDWDPENDATGKLYAKVLTEWFPVSSYKRDEKLPYLEIFSGPGMAGLKQYKCEVWVPVLQK